MRQIKVRQIKVRQTLKKSVDNFPTQCGVYLMRDKTGKPVYIGKAKNLKSRVRSYFSNDTNFKNTFLLPRVQNIDYIVTETEAEAFLMEAGLVKQHKPRYNVRLKDDKSYPYIRCSMEEAFPRFHIERKVKKRGSLYFGPYTDVGIARRMTRFLSEHFKIRDCSNHFMKSRTKPCLTYDIGCCTAPCVKKVNSKKYNLQVKKSLSFLKGKGKEVLKDMEKQMQKLSQKEQFESAARLRDRIKAVNFCREKQSVVGTKTQNMDVMAFYGNLKEVLFQTLHIRAGAVTGHRFYYESNIKQNFKKPSWGGSQPPQHSKDSFILQYYMDNLIPDQILLSSEQISDDLFPVLEKALFKIKGKPVKVSCPKSRSEKRLMDMALKNAQSRFKEQYSKKKTLLKGLKEIQQKFKLKSLPKRIECFDVSHFQGKDQTASQVVFENGEPKKSDYRKYKIRTVKGVDDFLALKEVLDRRFKHKEYLDPDLLIVDGGKGQLKQAVLVLKSAQKKHIAVTGMAKARVQSDFSAKEVKLGEERFFVPGRKNAIVFSSHSQGGKILIRLRDEAHRFAITYHRKLSKKSFFS